MVDIIKSLRAKGRGAFQRKEKKEKKEKKKKKKKNTHTKKKKKKKRKGRFLKMSEKISIGRSIFLGDFGKVPVPKGGSGSGSGGGSGSGSGSGSAGDSAVSGGSGGSGGVAAAAADGGIAAAANDAHDVNDSARHPGMPHPLFGKDHARFSSKAARAAREEAVFAAARRYVEGAPVWDSAQTVAWARSVVF
jgi:hypothetical protein